MSTRSRAVPPDRPGVQSIINGLKSQGELSHEEFVDTCLDLMGPLDVDGEARAELVSHAEEEGRLSWGTQQESDTSTQRVGEMLQLIVSLRDCQFA